MVIIMEQKHNKSHGFTLVEVIVVLVILAILAALLIPAMTRWIDKAKEKSAIVGCRTCVVAAQTLASELYGTQGAGNVTPTESAVMALAKIDGSVSGISINGDNALVEHLTYTDPSGLTVLYCYNAPSCHALTYTINASSAGGGEGGGEGGTTNPVPPPPNPNEGFIIDDGTNRYQFNVAAEVPTSGRLVLETGKIYYFKGAYYVAKNPSTLTDWSLTHADQSYDMVKANVSSLVGYNNSATVGDLAIDNNGQLVVCATNWGTATWTEVVGVTTLP